eukprot:4057947-Alexandrium_andersonii.AAC.1
MAPPASPSPAPPCPASRALAASSRSSCAPTMPQRLRRTRGVPPPAIASWCFAASAWRSTS